MLIWCKKRLQYLLGHYIETIESRLDGEPFYYYWHFIVSFMSGQANTTGIAVLKSFAWGNKRNMYHPCKI